MSHLTAETDEVCDVCMRDIAEGETVFTVKSRIGHNLVCDMCRFIQTTY